MHKIQKSMLTLCLPILALLFVFVAGELTFRAYYGLLKDHPFMSDNIDKLQPHKILGWGGHFHHTSIDREPKLRIFVVGDSFTNAMGIPKNKTYFTILAQSLQAEVWAYGGGGYGTLQEFMIIDEYLDKIKPDLLLLQVCTNDFMNNQFEFDKINFVSNNNGIRPYLVDKQIQYLYPRPMKYLKTHSRMFFDLATRVENTMNKSVLKNILYRQVLDICNNGIKHPIFNQSFTTTSDLMTMIKKRAADIPLIAFTANDAPPGYKYFEDIFKKLDVPFIAEIPSEIHKAEQNGITMTMDEDKHWNTKGHYVAGLILSNKLKGIINP